MKLISGTANEPLARSIADVLDVPLTQVDIERFRDQEIFAKINDCLLYTSPSPRDATLSRMPSSA